MSVPPTPPDDTQGPDAGGAPDGRVAGDCPRCGTAYDEGQEYCLECGLRLPTVAVAPGVAPAAAAGGPAFPATWVALVLVFLVIAALGAAAAIAFSRDDDSPPPVAATDSLPPAPTSQATTSRANTDTDTMRRTTRTTRTGPPPSPPEPRALIEWPNRDGYTVVLASLPADGGIAAARAQARRAGRAGLRQVGVLESSRHASLHPGYYVVFSGVYDSLEDAQAAVPNAVSSGYRYAYARRVTS